MQRYAISALAGSALVFFGAAALKAQTDKIFTLYAYEDPPFIVREEDGSTVSGKTIDVVYAILAKAGVAFNIVVSPIRRAIRAPLSERNTCAFSFVQNAGRIDRYQWVGPIHLGGWGIFSRPGENPIDTTKPLDEQIRAQRILVQGGAAMVAELTDAGYMPMVLSSSQIGIRALYAKRANYIAGGLTTLPTKAKMLGYPAPELVSVYREMEFFMACSLDIPPETIALLQQSLDLLVEGGALDLH